MKEVIQRINELAKIARQRELTPEEFIEREGLRKEYLSMVRGNAEKMLLHAKIKDREGKDVTPQKLAEAQKRMKEMRER